LSNYCYAKWYDLIKNEPKIVHGTLLNGKETIVKDFIGLLRVFLHFQFIYSNYILKNQIMRTFTLLLLLVVSAASFAIDTYFVRATGDATSWSTQAIADPAQVLTITDISELRAYTITGNGTVVGTGTTFYLAKGIYSASVSITAGYYLDLYNGEKIYGGFIGNEATIVLANRELTDRDGNGLVEPWEMKNESVITGNFVTTRNAIRLLSLRLNAEADGLTLKDFGYTKGGTDVGGPIFIGTYAVPSTATTTTAGILKNCAIVNVSAQGRGGAALMTNADSKIENCLFEQCLSVGQTSSFDGFGGAVYLHRNGGQIKNSVFRNNKAASAGTRYGNGGAIFAEAPAAATNAYVIIENSLFYNNSAPGGTSTTSGFGGAVRTNGIAGYRGAQIINCTFANNDNKSATSGSVEVINSGIIANCINYGGTMGFRANTAIANYYLEKCISTVANLDMAANATSYPNVIFDAAADFGFARPTTFSGATFPGDADYATKIAEIRKANFSSSKSTFYLASNYGLASLPTSYTAITTPFTVNITAALPAKDINGFDRVLATNTLGAYNYVADATAPTVVISSTVTEGATTSLNSIPCTITFNEPINLFDVSDIVLKNALATDFVAVNSEVFTFNITPAAKGSVTINVASAAAADFGGNNSSAAAQYSFVSDISTAVSNAKKVCPMIYSSIGKVVFENAIGQTASIFTTNGQLIKSQLMNSDKVSIPVANGFYIVKVGNQNTKLFVK
jgi:hypothetical protein